MPADGNATGTALAKSVPAVYQGLICGYILLQVGYNVVTRQCAALCWHTEKMAAGGGFLIPQSAVNHPFQIVLSGRLLATLLACHWADDHHAARLWIKGAIVWLSPSLPRSDDGPLSLRRSLHIHVQLSDN